MDQKYQDIVDQHKQLRTNSCFQMAPELALKLAGILKPDEYPFQNEKWDKKGYEPYKDPIPVGSYLVTFTTETFLKPSYDALKQRLKEKLKTGCFPIVSIRSSPLTPTEDNWHGYVVVEAIGDDFEVVSKSSPPCSVSIPLTSSPLATLDTEIKRFDTEKVDCLFWQSEKI